MTEKEQKLVESYLQHKQVAEEEKKLANDTLHKLSELSEHKVGEIIKWTEHKQKNTGSFFSPHYVDLPPKDMCAVLTSIEAVVDEWRNGAVSLNYKYGFNSINKDGSLSKNSVYPRSEYKWTGEIFKKPQNS